MENEVRKYPAEVFPLDVDFSSGMATGETITAGSSEVTAYDGDSAASGIIKAGSVSASGQKLFATVENGEKGKVYRLEFKAITSAGSTLIHNIQLRIIQFQVKP